MSIADAPVVSSGPAALQASKLRVQARGRSIERPRLRRSLENAPDARLVLVSAPPGFGKTTLIADWLRTSDVRGAWFTLDRGDNDVVRFARYLVAAVRQLVEDADVASFEPGRPFEPESVLSALLASIDAATARGAHLAVILDDYHLIGDPTIHSFVASLIERLPPHVRLVIVTRADPPLPLARLRARGELTELRAEDLRFSASEAAELLGSATVTLADAEVEDLTRRTEGWAAVLRLAAVSLKGRADQAELVRRFGATHRYILDYVVDEVLAGLAPDTHEFLLRTSILERMSGSLCDAVAGGSNGQARLEELERANLLIVPLDDERQWYRYHALFAEILRSRLSAMHPDAVAGLHAKASAWHEGRGNGDEAVTHALASGDVERIRRVMVLACRARLRAGEMSTVRRWLDALPPGAASGDAELIVIEAWYRLYVGRTDGVSGLVEDAEAALEDGQDNASPRPAAIRAELALVRSYLASLSGASAASAIEHARRALALLPDGLPAPSEANLRGSARALLALGLLQAGELDAAVEAYEASLADLRASGNAFAVGRSITDIARVAIDRGEPDRAVRVCETELQRNDGACSVARSGAVWAALARARAELGQFELADAAARRALELATREGDAASVRYAQATLDRMAPSVAPARSGSAADRRVAGLVEPLSNRELEVLRLVALGRSNTEIAADLFVTVGTVKAHIHAICGKLGAANRVQAIVRGRELGLLD